MGVDLAVIPIFLINGNRIMNYLFFLLVMILGLSAQPVSAQSFIEPTSPLGGVSASPLNGSLTAQRKLGSLLIGSSSTTSFLCLNSDSVINNDTNYCISSWSQVRGNYVTLAQTDLSSITFPSLSDHVVASGRTADIGYTRLQANGSANQLYTLILEATGSASQPATALFASDSGVSTNYAAKFNGAVYIGDGTTTSTKKFCLNGTADVDTNVASPTYGKGCISSWSQLASFIPSQNFVLLQSLNALPVAQQGRIAISGSGVFATDSRSGLVIGAPPAGTGIAISCGDGMCNGSETGGSCPIDCDYTPPNNVSNVSGNASAATQSVTWTWTNPSSSDFAGVRVVRTIDSPPTGPNHSNPSGSYTVASGSSPNNQLTNTGLQLGVNYYYTFYAYDAVGTFASGVTQSLRLSSGDGCTSGCGGVFD